LKLDAALLFPTAGNYNNKFYKSFMLLSVQLSSLLSRKFLSCLNTSCFNTPYFYLTLHYYTRYKKRFYTSSKVNVLASCDKTFFLEPSHMLVLSAKYDMSKSQENPSRNITLMRKSGLSLENKQVFI